MRGLVVRLVIVGAAVLSLGAVDMVIASDAAAYWESPGNGVCVSESPPAGQTGGDYWVGSDGTCSADWISQDDFNALVNRDVAAGDEATSVSIPADIPTADAGAGSSMWDSLASAAASLKGSALDFLGGLGDWPPLSALGSVPELAGVVGVGYVGWQIGGAIASFLGIDSPGDSGDPEDNDFYWLSGSAELVPCPAGWYPVFGQQRCSAENDYGWPPAGSDELLVDMYSCATNYNGGAGCAGNDGFYGVEQPATIPAGEYPCTVSGFPAGVVNLPAGATQIRGQEVPCYDGNGNLEFYETRYAYTEPFDVISLPGPGQNTPPLAATVTGSFTPPSEAQQKANAESMLQSPDYDQIDQYECADYGPSGPCPFWLIVPTPGVSESGSNYATDIANVGLTANPATLPETDTGVGNGDVVETNPEPGSVVAPDSTVDVAVNPPSPKVSQPDSRCDLDNGAGSPGDPGNPPPDGTNYPAYQGVEGSPYPADVDPTNSSPPQTEIPLRWGTTDWGWRHILQSHPYNSNDQQQTMDALASDPSPTTGWQSTNQWIFHYFYTEPDGGDDGGTITCVRSVPVEYWQDPKAGAVGVTGIRGIQNSYTGLYLGGLPGH